MTADQIPELLVGGFAVWGAVLFSVALTGRPSWVVGRGLGERQVQVRVRRAAVSALCLVAMFALISEVRWVVSAAAGATGTAAAIRAWMTLRSLPTRPSRGSRA